MADQKPNASWSGDVSEKGPSFERSAAASAAHEPDGRTDTSSVETSTGVAGRYV
jgi:hypothetical protein